MAEDEKYPQPEEETEMASQEGLNEALEETRPFIQEPHTAPSLPIIEEENTPTHQRRMNVGNLRDRIAAGLLDGMVLGYLYIGTFCIYNYAFWREFFRPFPIKGHHPLMFHLVFGLLAFLYFFISEGVFFTTIGKFFCRLSVRNVYGGPASLFAVALRNLFRPIDTLLLLYPTWLLLEKTRHQQRLGDLIAGTVVMKHYGTAPLRLPVEGKKASGSARLIMGLIDGGLLLLWLGGFALWIDYQRPNLSLLILFLLPLLYLIWQLVWDGLFHCTLGQWIFGCRLSQEDGSPVHFSEAIIRAIFKPLDLGTGIILFLSNRGQTPSDAAAGCMVVHAKRPLTTLIGIVVAVFVISGVWFLGTENPNHYLSSSFRVNFLSKIFTIKVGGQEGLQPSPIPPGLTIRRFSFLENDRITPRDSAEFQPGESIHYSFDISGFTVRDKMAWIQEDLTVRYPDNTIGYRQESIVDFHQVLPDPETPLEITNTLTLLPDAIVGHYTLILTLKDRFSNRQLAEQRTFRVLAPTNPE